MTKFGIYVDGYSDANHDLFESRTGISVDLVGGYGAEDHPDYAGMNPGWIYGAGWLGDTGKPIVLSMPMIPETGGLAEYEAVAAGLREDDHKAWANTILANTPGTDPIYVRTTWEVGGEWFHWTADAEADPETFAAAWAKFAEAFHEVSPRFKMVWDVAADRSFGEEVYPGDTAVDVVSVDIYWSELFNGNTPQQAFEDFKTNHAHSLDWLASFAATHGTAMAISELGVPSNTEGGITAQESAEFLGLLGDWIEDQNNDAGEEGVDYVLYWNVSQAYAHDAVIDAGDTVVGAALNAFADQIADGGTPPPTEDPAANHTIGSGPDALVLKLTENDYNGSAQFTVHVDGVQIGGTLTASAEQGSSVQDTVTVNGDWGPGSHSAVVTFLNDAWGGTPETDRNLHLEAASYNGVAISGVADSMLSGNETATVNFTESGTPTEDPGANLSAGSGPDTLVLKITEQEYLASAQYTVEVDDVQVGGTFTASADHGSSQLDTLTLNGDWGAGSHTVTVNFLNDEWGGTSTTDKNLWVESATYNGAAIGTGLPLEIINEWPPNTFSFTDAGSGGGAHWPEPNPDPNPNYTYPTETDWNGRGQLVSLFNQYGDPPDVSPGQWWTEDAIVARGWQPTDAMLA